MKAAGAPSEGVPITYNVSVSKLKLQILSLKGCPRSLVSVSQKESSSCRL